MNISPIKMTDQKIGEGGRVRTPFVFDPLLLLAAVGLAVCSYVTLNGVNVDGVVGSYYSHRQAIYCGIGLIVALLISRVDYTRLREYRYGFYVILIVLNVVVFATPATLGATRRIPLPFFAFQPSEFGKLLLLLTLAAFAVDRSRRLHERRMTAQIMLLAIFPALIVIAQPDLGTGLVYVSVAFAVLFFSGTSWKQIVALLAMFATAVVLVLAVAPSLGVNVLKTYQKQRLTTFINPPTVCNSQKDQTCYQLQESLIAIGSGGKTGRGVTGATQAKFDFLPEDQDDFIFAVVGETYGFVGAALVLSLYALLIWRTLRIMTVAKNLFGTLIAGGILAMLMFQVFVNVGMTVGIMPVTGVPLPLLSYGGSSVLVTFIAMGLLQSIYIQARMSNGGKVQVLL
jgi:rod shape determining protein RodA